MHGHVLLCPCGTYKLGRLKHMFIKASGSAYHPFLDELGIGATKPCVRKNLSASLGCPHMNAAISSKRPL